MIKGIHSWDVRMVHHMQINNLMNHINRMKDKNNIIIAIDAQESIRQNSTSIHDKISQKIGYRESTST